MVEGTEGLAYRVLHPRISVLTAKALLAGEITPRVSEREAFSKMRRRQICRSLL